MSGASGKGEFAGGPHLMQAVTQGPPGERFYGNVPGDSRTPDTT